MDDGDFEWDDAKAAANYAAHGVTFEAGRDVFKDPFAIEWLDERVPYGEDRRVIVGMVEDHLLYVAYTIRNYTGRDKTRIISVRGAEPHERRRYHEKNRN
jgi:hypothetical protein